MAGTGLLTSTYYIPLASLTACVLILAFRKYVGMQGAWIGILATFYGLVHSLLIGVGLYTGSVALPETGLQGKFFEAYVTWFTVGNFDFRVGVLIDGLSSMMLIVVTLVSFLVQVYSVAYMHDHVRFGRYFAYVNLFTFAMLTLVVANDMLLFFIGWELVGVCSYLLISFDFEREAASYAGRKAFLTTKLGDLGFYIGLLTIFNTLGTFNIPLLSQNIATVAHPTWIITMIAVLLFCGAVGKSAQIPLHVWLPDAMEGPTPASALIHAATMVAAGVYMVARVFFLFEASPAAMEMVAWVGVTTALVAASMGLVASDIKRVLAFSTVSQLGFMMAALGCGGYAAGMFHLTTHAAFKALLFLCAGSVIHAVHTNDMWNMGGLKTRMPVTATTYLIATLTIAGCPLLSGFFSKEEVLAAAYHHNPAIFALLVVASFLTSFYMFRTWFLTFSGLPRDKERFQHAHESPMWMTVPLMTLAFVSVFLGLFLWYHGNLSTWIHWGVAEEHHGGMIVMASSLAAFLLGLIGASWVYASKPPKYAGMAARFSGVYRVLAARYKFDEAYLWLIGRVYYPLVHLFARWDYEVLDQGVVDGVGRNGRRVSWLSRFLDDEFVDPVLVDGNGKLLSRLGHELRRLQSGLAQSYLFWMAIGVGAMLAWVANFYK